MLLDYMYAYEFRFKKHYVHYEFLFEVVSSASGKKDREYTPHA